ncbi:Methyltransferase domain [Trypanosoma vivax]|uniref:Methyltransferase domain-containing protein n=1 Tax=Trypanosoma vivax (strain Y486) TaxID=1055687 RepID=G0TVM4_TRYVY|nr:hypothetical protein TRVL_07565 [Trypanosoma vivax]KAH8620478.1 Methyltransferase domain [Trypanosoma vivax]CCC47990.1 conserved hypothetical protein [Trypanosoma vivax Y486]
MRHRIVLPLPPEFSPTGQTAEGFSVFHFSESDGDDISNEQHARLTAYVDQLCEFLHRTRLVQYNPDDFFYAVPCDLEVGDRDVEGRSASHAQYSEPMRHPCGRIVPQEEVDYVRELCNSFTTLMPNGDALFDVLHHLIRDGPPPGSAACLQSFYRETKSLMIGRKKRAQNDAVRVTLNLPCELSFGGYDDHSQHTRKVRADRIMQTVIAHGMSPKKQHEVCVMRDTVVDLVAYCNKVRHPSEPVETVINIGEGKGYVSRALALCDGLQMVGLDCNPLHKERAIERVSHILQASLSVDSLQPDTTGRDMLNLFYEPQGHMASVACSVGPCVDWVATLRGHVRIRVDRSCGDIIPMSPARGDAWTVKEEEGALDGGSVEVRGGTRSCWANVGIEEVRKMQCRICGHILRMDAAAAIIRHTRHHLNSGHEMVRAPVGEVSSASLPQRETVDKWNELLPVAAYVARVTSTFFAPVDLGSCTVGGGKRPRHSTVDVVHNGTADDAGAGGIKCSDMNDAALELEKFIDSSVFLADICLPRGVRVEALLPIRRGQYTSSHTKNAQRNSDPSGEALEECLYTRACLTVVGYDCARNRHLVIADSGRRKEGFVLLRKRGWSHMDGAEMTVDACELPPPVEGLALGIALLIRILPIPPKNTPVVCVPSLSNTVMIGLHTCGDLGSNICRVFTASSSRGLLLVSCCWHALTRDGFPLSRELSLRGWRTEMLSLLLATQPHDMWASTSPEGHRASALLLFYRGLLKQLWKKIAQRWSVTGEGCGCCGFVDAPHLQPAFLRRMAKMKHNMTLALLYKEVCHEYFPSGKGNKGLAWQQGHGGKVICSACRAAQATFITAGSTMSLATSMEHEYLDKYFSPFLGFTILRMWMCHLVETLLLLDRVFYLSEQLRCDRRFGQSVVSLAPLFDGALSPRMFGILVRRLPATE